MDKREYYLRNREKIKERNRKYKEAHEEQIAAYQKRYAMTHDRTEYYHMYYLKKKEAAKQEKG